MKVIPVQRIAAISGYAPLMKEKPMANKPWTPWRVALMQELQASGSSASQIAQQIGGVTRNAVLGKLYRLKNNAQPEMPTVASPIKAEPLSANKLREIRGNIADFVARIEGETPGLVSQVKSAPTLSLKKKIRAPSAAPKSKRRPNAYKILKATGCPYRHQHMIPTRILKRDFGL